LPLGQRLYRIHRVSFGTMPRYKDFMSDLNEIAKGVRVGEVTQEEQLSKNLARLTEVWTRREPFAQEMGQLTDQQYVDRLIQNAGISLDFATRQDLATQLLEQRETRAGVLLKIVDEKRLTEKEAYPSLVVLHYFAYLGRNPDDPPDGDMRGFNFWVGDLERNHDPSKIAIAFQKSGEYLRLQENSNAQR